MTSPPFGSENLIIREDEEISGGTLRLDGHYFRRCRIIGCKVSFNGENWGHEDTLFTDCDFEFGGRAQFAMESIANLIGRDQWIGLFATLKNTPPPVAN
jgi:hypothetical protein